MIIQFACWVIFVQVAFSRPRSFTLAFKWLLSLQFCFKTKLVKTSIQLFFCNFLYRKWVGLFQQCFAIASKKRKFAETCKRLWARLGRPSSRCPGYRGSFPAAALSSKLFLSSGEWLVFINRLMVVDLWLVGSTLYKLRSYNVWWSLYQTHQTCHFSKYRRPQIKPCFTMHLSA